MTGTDPNGEPQTAPLHVAPPSAQPAAGGVAPDHSVAPAATSSTPSDACPTCGSPMAPDQRYCLRCGHRRGDPRLPFMDAVVFMDAVKRPGAPEAGATPPPPRDERKPGVSAQTTLVAGIATLVLAVGVGVLIGRTGNDSAPVAGSPTKVIQVGGTSGGGGEETATASEKSAGGSKEAKGATGSKKGKKEGGKAKEESAAPVEEGANGGSKAAQEVLHTAPDVKEAKPEAQVGEKCEKGTAGCSEGGEFDGSFFE